jgi:hypothetical protein
MYCTLKPILEPFYLLNEKDNTLILTGKFALLQPKDTTEFSNRRINWSSSVGTKKQISLTDISEDQIRITSMVLNAKPKAVCYSYFTLTAEP